MNKWSTVALCSFVVLGCRDDSTLTRAQVSPVSVATGGLETSGRATVRADGSLAVELASFTVASPVGVSPEIAASFHEEREGQELEPGDRVPVATLILRSGFEAPLSLSPGADTDAIVTIEWYHAMSVTEPSDPLCDGENEDGKRVCGVRWVPEQLVLSRTSSEDFRFDADAIEIAPNGHFKFKLDVNSFELHDAAGHTSYCCGHLAASADSVFDDNLVADIDKFEGWSGSFSCGYDGLDAVPMPQDCPAFW